MLTESAPAGHGENRSDLGVARSLPERPAHCVAAGAFPADFAWGCGTSPTQVEGETVNEWADFVAADGARPDDGPNHWRRYRYDFSCLTRMNLNSYRLGFDWGRLQTEPAGPLNRDVCLRYLEMLAELRSRGIEPYLTVFHFACPRWLAEMGGWTHPDSPRLFADFVRRLVEATDGEVRNWFTVNEPAVYALMGYLLGRFPPCRRWRPGLYLRVLDNLARGHALAYELIKSRLPEARVGIAKHFKRILPCRPWQPVDQLSAWLARRFFDRRGLEPFLHHQGRRVSDFVGVNYYGCIRLRGLGGVAPITGHSAEHISKCYGGCCDDMWEQDAPYFAECLQAVHRQTGLPLIVSECGAATTDEELRVRLLREHLVELGRAVKGGCDVRGFFYWSLMDNYEWSEGLTKRFGLLAVDFADPERRRNWRRAARLLGQAAAANSVDFFPTRRSEPCAD